MVTANICVELFSLSELSEGAKIRAIEDHREFMLSIMSPENFISGDPQYDTREELEKAYKTEYKYYEDNDEPIIENIKVNEYLFFANGKLAHTIKYCDDHPLSGETYLMLQDKEYKIA